MLADVGFEPAAIAGCSIGAVIGAMIAAGRTPEEIRVFVLSQKFTQLFQFPITSLGISKLDTFERRIMTFIGSRRFEGLEIPLAVNATDLVSGATVVYDRGLLWPALRASIAVPGVLSPVIGGGHVLVDGGVIDQHPFTLLPERTRRFILVNASPTETLTKKKPNMLDIIRASMNLMQNTMTEMRLAGRDARDYVVIEPAVHGRNLLEREKQFDHLMTLGEQAVTERRRELETFIHRT